MWDPMKPLWARFAASPLRLALSVLLFVAASWLFAGIAEDVATGDPLVAVDQLISQWFHERATPLRTRWMLLFTHAHGTAGIIGMGIAFGLYLLWRKDWYWLMALGVILPGGMLANVLIKQLIHRDRPRFDHPLLTLSTYSFPSGHVTGATLFYGVFAAFLVSQVSGWRTRSGILVCAGLLVICVAITRMYLGAHYFSDVVAAAAGSTAWLVLGLLAVDTLRRR